MKHRVEQAQKSYGGHLLSDASLCSVLHAKYCEVEERSHSTLLWSASIAPLRLDSLVRERVEGKEGRERERRGGGGRGGLSHIHRESERERQRQTD